MSSTTALGITPDRRPVTLAEFRNAYGWSPSIWGRLLKAVHGFDGSWFHGQGEVYLHQLWQEIETLPEWQQIPLILTFDTGIVPWQEYGRAAAMLDEFDTRLPAPSNHANHVPVMADLLRSGPEAPAFGVYGTSVSDNPFDPMHYCDGYDPPREPEGGCGSMAERGWCDGHGSGLPFKAGVIYALERHRHHLPESWND